GEVLRLVSERAYQGQARIQVGSGDTDASALSGHQTLIAAQVRTPPQEISRHANGDFRRHGRDSAHSKVGQEIANRYSQENAQRVIRLTELDFHLFLERQRVVQIRPHLALVDPAASAAFEAIFRLLGELRLHDDIFVDVLEL